MILIFDVIFIAASLSEPKKKRKPTTNANANRCKRDERSQRAERNRLMSTDVESSSNSGLYK